MKPQSLRIAELLEEAAWLLYCDATKGALSAKDFWYELSKKEQKKFLGQAAFIYVEEISRIYRDAK